MHSLRTVTVLEHEVVPVIDDIVAAEILPREGQWLTAPEAQALIRLNDQRSGFCCRLAGGVKLTQYCGIVRLPTCILEVLPKVGMADSRLPDELERSRSALLSMLQCARQISMANIGPATQATVQAPLLDIFIEAFLLSALEQAHRGLLSRYVGNGDDLPVIRGRFQATEHIKRNLVRPHLLHCEYEEFTSDNPYNRAVRAALDLCRDWISRATTQRLWFETHARYASVSSVRMKSADVARLARDRTTRRYTSLLKWCEWLLALASPALSAGPSLAPGLLFDMNKLFEAHVARLVGDCLGENQAMHMQGPKLHLAGRGQTGVFLLKPDITVWRVSADSGGTSIDRVVDAKWKRLNPTASDFGVDQADVYQMLAYALRYDCRSLELAYPKPDDFNPTETPLSFEIKGGGFGNIEAVTISLKLIPIFAQ